MELKVIFIPGKLKLKDGRNVHIVNISFAYDETMTQEEHLKYCIEMAIKDIVISYDNTIKDYQMFNSMNREFNQTFTTENIYQKIINSPDNSYSKDWSENKAFGFSFVLSKKDESIKLNIDFSK